MYKTHIVIMKFNKRNQKKIMPPNKHSNLCSKWINKKDSGTNKNM